MANEWTMKPPHRYRPFQSTELSGAFLYTRDGQLQSINFQPSASHHPQDECDKEQFVPWRKSSQRLVKNTIEHATLYSWQNRLASKVLDDGKTQNTWR